MDVLIRELIEGNGYYHLEKGKEEVCFSQNSTYEYV